MGYNTNTLQLWGEVFVVLRYDNFVPLGNNAVVPFELRARYDGSCNPYGLISVGHSPVNVWKDRGMRQGLVYGGENVRFQN